MSDVPVLAGGRLVLRPPLQSDVAERLALGSDPDILRMFGGDPRDGGAISQQQAQAWHDRIAGHPLAWVVEHDGRVLGHVRLDGVDGGDRRASLAIGFFDPAKLGVGLGREAIRLVLRYAFGALALHRIAVRVVSYNDRALRCYQACGFVVEGCEREAAFTGGAWHDDILMGILAREFDAAIEPRQDDFSAWGVRRL
jgi:RimJ/RimL family protein N-acetyltransferase